jgi:hypothetical protein
MQSNISCPFCETNDEIFTIVSLFIISYDPENAMFAYFSILLLGLHGFLP